MWSTHSILKRHASCAVAVATMDVMMKMTTEDVRRLRAQFSADLTLEQFVRLTKLNLRDRISNELDFVVSAIDLFHTIDVNGDETLEWDEFAGYMLDAGQAKAEFGTGNDSGEKRYQAWPLASRDAKTPLQHIKTHVQQLVFLSDMAAIAYFEHGGDVVYIYALHFDQNDAPRHVATIRLHTAFQEHIVLDMSYVPIKKWLVISSMRGTAAYLSVWQLPELTSASRSPMMLRRIELASLQEHLTWLPTLQLLATASAVFPALASATPKATKIHQLLLWDLATLTTLGDFDHRDRIKGVKAMAGFTTPSNRVFLVVGREDGQLTVIETETGHDVQTLDAHGHGVRVLAYSSECEVLASAGAHAYASDESTHHILIWRVNSSGRLSLETTLRDHDAPLELLEFVDATRQLVSVDVHGVFHVYATAGLDKWQCLQAVDAHDRMNACVFVPETSASDAVLVMAGARVAYFDLCVCREREEAVFVAYCRALNLIVGVTATTVLLWKADTGTLWKSFSYDAILRSTPPSGHNDAAKDDATSASSRILSAVCVDDRERKLLLGDDRGSVRVVNIANGNVVKALDPHDSAVLWLSYVLRSKRVISVSLDSVVHVSDENNAIGYYIPFGAHKPQSVVLRSLRFLPDGSTDDTSNNNAKSPPSAAKFEVTRAIGNQGLDLLAMLISGSPDYESFIQLWNSDLSHAQGTCVAPIHEEITCLCFSGSSRDIVGGTAKGTAYLWAASDGTTYHRSVEFRAEVDAFCNDDAPAPPTIPPSTAQILHILTAPVEVLEAPSPETSTFLTADGVPTSSKASGDGLPMLSKSHIMDERLRREALDGLYVVTGDENGVITTWLIVRATDTSGKGPKAASTTSQPSASSKGHETTALFQHEEMVMGYEAIAALHANARKRSRRHVHDVRQCHARARWHAHHTAVTSLRSSSGDPLVLLSSCVSGKVKIWSFQGEMLGVLDHFATRRSPERRPWRFPVDMKQRRQQKEAFAEQFLDRSSRGDASKRHTPSMTVLQARLSMTPQEMERAATPKTTRRRIVQASDVERAIRSLALSQVSTKRATIGSRARARSVATAPEPTLHALLTEVGRMEPPVTDDSLSTDNGRRRYSMVTISDLKHALRPRTRSSQQLTIKTRSSAAVHCDAMAPPHEVIVTTTAAMDGRIELSDLQNAPYDREPSNQEMEKKPLKKRPDGVLNYHVKLAHAWNKYAT